MQIIILNEDVSLPSLAKQYVMGGVGPGSYYFPVMLQTVLILPLICALINKLDIYGLLICFGTNIAFEILKTVFHMPKDLYRLLVFRYIFILAYGCFLYKKADKERRVGWIYYVCGAAGAAYIVAFCILGYKPLFTELWTKTSVFAVLFVVPVMALLIKWKNCRFSLLEWMGKASFDIFLAQMAYYWAFAGLVYKVIPVPYVPLAVNIVVICAAGLLFYRIENPITTKIIKSIRK